MPEPAPPEPAPPAERESSPSRRCAIELPGVRVHVASAANVIAYRFEVPQSAIIGKARRPGRAGSDHPRGLALDFRVNRGAGDDLAEYALAHRVELGITYVIWRQRINHGNGWKAMEDRGGATANHYDHVHVSFGARDPGGARCLP